MDTATAEREETRVNDDDGLGHGGDDGSGIPGGQKPQDEVDPPAGEANPTPPTPPAHLPDDRAEPDHDAAEGLQLTIGGNRQLGIKVGGRKPDTSVLKLKGTKIDLDGQFDREDRFQAVITAQVTGDNDQDTIDTLSGEVKSTSKAQSATLCGVTRLEQWLALKLEDEKLRVDVFAALDLEIPDEFLPAEPEPGE